MGEAANWLGAAAAVLCLGGRFDDAVPFATEGLALARAHGASDRASPGTSLRSPRRSPSENPNGPASCSKRPRTRTSTTSTTAQLAQLTVAAAMIRDWPLAARFATRSIPHIHWINHRPYLSGILTISARALADTDPEAAATIQGAAHTLMMHVRSRNRAGRGTTNRGARRTRARSRTCS